MKRLRSGGRFALLLLMVIVLLAGCMPSGGTSDKGWTTLTVDGSTLYAMQSTGQAVALDLNDEGALLWKYPLEVATASPGCSIARQATTTEESSVELGAVYGSPVVADGLMLFGSSEKTLVALDTETGDPAWTYPVDAAVIGGVAVADGVAYLGTVSGQVYAIDLATQDSAWSEPFATGDRVWSTPLVDGDRLYIASMDHHLYALDRSQGTQIWSADLGGAIQGDVTLSDGVLYAGGVDRRLHAIDAQDGTRLWETEMLEAWIWGAPVVSGETVYFATLDGQLHGYAASTGERNTDSVTLDGGISAGPVQLGDDLAIGTDAGLVYLYSTANGQAEIVYGSTADEQRGAYLSMLLVRDNVLYLGSSYGFVVALDPSARSPELWVYPSSQEE